MQRVLSCLVLIGIVAIYAVSAEAQTIVGSAHDFSGEGWSGGEICGPCHTPHNALASDIPLWSHALTVATFTLYSSSTLDADLGQPTGASKACLSCHDGTVALDSFGGNVGTDIIDGDANLTTDLSDDHPVSFIYDGALAADDGDLYDPSTASSGLGGTIDEDLLLAGRMECSSCHNPHNESGEDHLLTKSNAGSALCLTCHDK